ncbi:MAG: hypothetical protein H7Z21_03120 [Hymenobacter sp.]|nr:hypothetical protein [Hymenobacter sp.]
MPDATTWMLPVSWQPINWQSEFDFFGKALMEALRSDLDWAAAARLIW